MRVWSEAKGPRMRTTNAQGQEKIASYLKQTVNLPFLHIFVLFGTYMEWMLSTAVVRPIFLVSLQIPILVSSGNTLKIRAEMKFPQLFGCPSAQPS